MSTYLRLLVTAPSGLALDLSSYLEAKSQWYVDQQFGRQGDSAQFYLYDEHENGALHYAVQPMSTVQLRDEGIGATLFAGIVTRPEYVWLGPTWGRWQLTCADYTYYADSAIIFADFEGQAADDIMVNLTTQADCGILAAKTSNGGFVYPAPMIPDVKINYLQLSAAWKRVMAYASQTTLYGWYVDENRQLRFYDQAQAPDSRVVFTDNVKSAATRLVGYYERGDNFVYTWDGTQLRTRCVVRGAYNTFTQTDNFVGNGSQTAWPLTYPTDSSLTAAQLTVGGVNKTVQLDDGSTPSTDYVVTQMPNGQWFLRAGTDAAPGSGVIITFTYKGRTPIIAQADNRPAQLEYTGPNKGVFSMYIADTAITNTITALQRGQRELAEYAFAEERVQFYTTEDFQGHVRAGQLITFENATIPDSKRGWQTGISDKFLVISNRITGTDKGVGQRVYQITAVRV